ncbi:cupin-like domain-containing protein [Altererythrobacter sp. MTPC7]|uniref:cupin-like domain-containing protein n=1 Tax=Altererythrobacter sp. MTPC7 TaxID=3056567 RepID=UPI0036F30524
MTSLPQPRPIGEFAAGDMDQASFEAIRQGVRPAVLRGATSDWPAVAAARRSDRTIADYLIERAADRQVGAIAAAPAEKGRFFYTDDLARLNFVKGSGALGVFMEDLLRAADLPDPPAMAVQSEEVGSLLPAFAQENRLDLLPGVAPRIWIGNRIRVAPHYDAKENVAVCVAGRRRFTVYPPEQIANLYPGPFELTPAGTPVSMVDIADPDLEKHSRYAEAAGHAVSAVLEPGDAIYIPYGWWHGVESLEAVSILVNYWWAPGVPDGVASPYDGLLQALLSFRHLPADQRAVWRTMLDYYVFECGGDPAGHLPTAAKGILGPASPALFDRMRAILRGGAA